MTQTSRAGLLTGLPDFDLGRGLTIRPAVTSGGGVPAPGAGVEGDIQPSLDVSQRIGANVIGSATVNTDFAETEVDARQINLTRFPLFFPDKRTFFLEGHDIFSFGLRLDEDVIPYFSRRIGRVDGFEVPILAGAKVNGRIGKTNFGGVAVGTRPREEAAFLHASDRVVRRFLQRYPRSVRVDWCVEPEADRDRGILRRAQRGTPGNGRLHADRRRHAAANQHLAGRVGLELHPV
ncbi:MAG TPA: DUF5916 domain-containing protein, partial [Rhodothermales bacterium]